MQADYQLRAAIPDEYETTWSKWLAERIAS